MDEACAAPTAVSGKPETELAELDADGAPNEATWRADQPYDQLQPEATTQSKAALEVAEAAMDKELISGLESLPNKHEADTDAQVLQQETDTFTAPAAPSSQSSPCHVGSPALRL